MTAVPSSTRPEARSTKGIPLLENGDTLKWAEFIRRYDAMPWVKKAELISGVVYMPSPVRFSGHGAPHFDLIGWLYLYTSTTPGPSGRR